MEQTKLKVQLLLPSDLVYKIEQDAEKNFMKKSSWFEKLARQYFEENDRKVAEEENRRKKLLKLEF